MKKIKIFNFCHFNPWTFNFSDKLVISSIDIYKIDIIHVWNTSFLTTSNDETTNLEKKNYLISRTYKSFNLVLKTWKVAIKLQNNLKSHKLEL